MPGAGELRDRFLFDQRMLDANGDRRGDWGDSPVVVATKVAYLRGTEAVQQARLQGSQPAILTVRASAGTRLITAGFRAVDQADATRIFLVTGATLTPDRAWVEVLVTTKTGQPNV